MTTITRALPNSYRKLQQSILHARETKSVVPAQDMAITPDVSTRIDNFVAPFGTAISNMHLKHAVQMAKTIEKNNFMRIAMGLEKEFIKHLNSCIKISELTGDGQFKPTDREYYKISSSQETLPKIVTEADVMMWGMYLVEGEQKRIADGKPALTQPSLATLGTAIQNFRTANNQQTVLKLDYDHALHDLEDMKPVAKLLVKDIWDDVENFYRHEAIEAKRDFCREWGVIYITRESKQSSDLIGTVKDANGMPLEHVHIEIPSIGRYEDSDIDGTYEFIDISEGKYNIKASKAGYITQFFENVNIVSEQENLLDITLVVDLESPLEG